MGNTEPEQQPHPPQDPDEWYGTPGTTEYAQSEAPVPENCDDESTHECNSIPRPVQLIPRVVLMGARVGGFPRRFIEIVASPTLTGANITKNCSGILRASSTISPNAIFELQSFEDGTCAFKSSKHEDVYLRAFTGDNVLGNGSSLVSRWFGGMGSVDVVRGFSGGTELLFKIHKVGAHSAEVVIESMRLPGKFLRLYPGMTQSTAVVNLQDGHGSAERFLLVISPPEESRSME